MGNEIKIDIKQTGFFVKLGEIDLWFDSSIENLRRFANVDEIAQEKLKEAQEKAEHIHFPDKIESVDDIDLETADAAFDVKKEFIAAQYDIVFGNGTFKKVYKKYPDIIALEKALDPLTMAIAKYIDEKAEEQGLMELNQTETLH